jgi:hypothetical protein
MDREAWKEALGVFACNFPLLTRQKLYVGVDVGTVMYLPGDSEEKHATSSM